MARTSPTETREQAKARRAARYDASRDAAEAAAIAADWERRLAGSAPVWRRGDALPAA